MIKQFLIQVIPGESTRMCMSEEELERSLQVWCASFFKTWSSGEVPSVHITSLSPERAFWLLQAHIKSRIQF